MNINWSITQTDINRIRKVVADNDNAFLKSRYLRNVEKQNIVINKEKIIQTMLMCLLTSQQRSGPNSTVGQFLRFDPFPITNDILLECNNLEQFIRTTLQQNGLTRYINRISIFYYKLYEN
jgi:hypothetical protein